MRDKHIYEQLSVPYSYYIIIASTGNLQPSTAILNKLPRPTVVCTQINIIEIRYSMDSIKYVTGPEKAVPIGIMVYIDVFRMSYIKSVKLY